MVYDVRQCLPRHFQVASALKLRLKARVHISRSKMLKSGVNKNNEKHVNSYRMILHKILIEQCGLDKKVTLHAK